MNVGGAAGCVIAGRLATAATSLEIVVLESGVNNRDDPLVTTPAKFLDHQAPGTTSFTYYKASPSPHLNYRAPTVHAADAGTSTAWPLVRCGGSFDLDQASQRPNSLIIFCPSCRRRWYDTIPRYLLSSDFRARNSTSQRQSVSQSNPSSLSKQKSRKKTSDPGSVALISHPNTQKGVQ